MELRGRRKTLVLFAAGIYAGELERAIGCCLNGPAWDGRNLHVARMREKLRTLQGVLKEFGVKKVSKPKGKAGSGRR